MNILKAAILAVRSLLRGDDCDGFVAASECHISHVSRTTSDIINHSMLRTVENMGGFNAASRLNSWLQALALNTI